MNRNRVTILKKCFLIFISFLISSPVIATTKEMILPKGSLVALAPPVANKDYFLFEFGFVTEKRIKAWDYHYNAYVTAGVFQDAQDLPEKLKAGALGIKAGVMLPTQPWVPLLFTTTLGFAKTVLHKNPFLGRDTQNADKKDMFLIEGGLLYHYDRYFLRGAYQLSNVKYFKRNIFFMIGVDY